MTPTDEAHFITLWQQGLSHDTMVQALGIPVGTAKSRAHTLQQRGLTQPRSRAGTSPRQQVRPPSTVHHPRSTRTPGS
jgi:DNA-directed RNA polymerase specialized sigma24 family protein